MHQDACCKLAASWFAPSSQFGVVNGGEADLEQVGQLRAGLTHDGQALLTATGREVDGIVITFWPAKERQAAYGTTAS